MDLSVRIERKSLMSGVVPVERCAKLVSIMVGFKSVEYNIKEKEVLFTMEAPANFSLSLVANMTDTMCLFLNGHDVSNELHDISLQKDKPVRNI